VTTFEILVPLQKIRNLAKLVICSCTSVVDVSQLGNIPDLSLLDCPGIRDVSALRKNSVLNVTKCLNISPETACFENVISLKTDILQSYKNSTYLRKVQSLEIMAYQDKKIFLPATTQTVYFNAWFLRDPIDLTNFSELKSVSLRSFGGFLGGIRK
jgi:hypothetical protein